MKEIPILTEKQIRHFWRNVWIRNKDQCWPWRLSTNEKGYGHIRLNDTIYYSHRVAYYIYNKTDPLELDVLHSCDNTKCCNPNHLSLGTHQDNIDDRERKGRNNPPKGFKHVLSVFTKEQIQQIREIRYLGQLGISSVELAKKFNVSKQTILRIINNKTYKEEILCIQP